MKKFALALIACLAFIPVVDAARPALGESIAEYQSILTALSEPEFNEVIPIDQVIVDISRKTPELNQLGKVQQFPLKTHLIH